MFEDFSERENAVNFATIDVKDSDVSCTDMETSNGVTCSINKVCFPPGIETNRQWCGPLRRNC